MTPVFADTEYWIALNSIEDDLHLRAVAVTGGLAGRRIVTSEQVLTEFLDGCATRGEVARRTAATFVRGLQELEAVRIVPHNTELFDRALSLYQTRPDKRWSLTDCSSIVLCGDENISDVLSHDHHFVQAGLHALLRTTRQPG